MKQEGKSSKEERIPQTGSPSTAYAFEYKDPAALPHLVASGTGRLAELIVQLAQEHDIPVQERQDLATILGSLPTSTTLPSESLGIIAEVISFLYHCNAEWAKEHGFMRELCSQRG